MSDIQSQNSQPTEKIRRGTKIYKFYFTVNRETVSQALNGFTFWLLSVAKHKKTKTSIRILRTKTNTNKIHK